MPDAILLPVKATLKVNCWYKTVSAAGQHGSRNRLSPWWPSCLSHWRPFTVQ